MYPYCLHHQFPRYVSHRIVLSRTGLVKEVQDLIPGWCNSIGLPEVNLSVGLGSAMALKEAGIKPGSVDIIIGCNVFCWRSEEEALEILANVFEALVSGGEFNCTDGNTTKIEHYTSQR